MERKLDSENVLERLGERTLEPIGREVYRFALPGARRPHPRPYEKGDTMVWIEFRGGLFRT